MTIISRTRKHTRFVPTDPSICVWGHRRNQLRIFENRFRGYGAERLWKMLFPIETVHRPTAQTVMYRWMNPAWCWCYFCLTTTQYLRLWHNTKQCTIIRMIVPPINDDNRKIRQVYATYRWGLHVRMCRMIGVECFLLCTTSMTCHGIVVYGTVRNSALSAKLCNKFTSNVHDHSVARECVTLL